MEKVYSLFSKPAEGIIVALVIVTADSLQVRPHSFCHDRIAMSRGTHPQVKGSLVGNSARRPIPYGYFKASPPVASQFLNFSL